MDIAINDEWFQGRGLAVRSATFFHGPKLLMLGEELKGKWGRRYIIRDNSGAEVKIRLKWNLIDPIPKVEMGSKEIILAPPLKWYEYAWIGLPLLLAHEGGAIGGLIGLAGCHASVNVFRKEAIGPAAKYLFSGLITIATIVAYFIFVVILMMIIGQARQ